VISLVFAMVRTELALNLLDLKALQLDIEVVAIYVARTQDRRANENGGSRPSRQLDLDVPLFSETKFSEFGNWTSCVRMCLQVADKNVCYTPDGMPMAQCTTGAHIECWLFTCLTAPNKCH
jgi:hypothetical protein